MKIGVLLEYIFAGTHCDSHFAHLCLFMMLLCLLYSFIKGVKEQLDAKDEEERRKHGKGKRKSRPRIRPSPILARTLLNSPSFDPAESKMATVAAATMGEVSSVKQNDDYELHLPELNLPLNAN